MTLLVLLLLLSSKTSSCATESITLMLDQVAATEIAAAEKHRTERRAYWKARARARREARGHS